MDLVTSIPLRHASSRNFDKPTHFEESKRMKFLHHTGTRLIGGEDLAYVTMAGETEQAILLRRREKREVMMAFC
jgi:hypothetical protein